MDEPKLKTVLVAVATCGRPAFLRRCLESIQKLETPPEVRLEILLVDNNPGGEAKPIAAEFQEGRRHTLHYTHEPERGIVRVRNRAVEEALARNVDAMGFLDDDGTVGPTWLTEAVSVLDGTESDVVGGPAEMLYPEGCPAWYRELLAEEVRPTGLLEFHGYHSLPATRNVIFQIHLVREWGLRFREEFNLVGGEDTFFFEEARRKGAITAWASEAPIYEEVPASRATFRWFLQRRFRHGTNRAQFARMLGEAGTKREQVRANWKRVWFHSVSYPLELIHYRKWERMGWLRTLGDIADALGSFLESLGYTYSEYRKIHGS